MRIGIVAGEASGDLLGSLLIKALRAQHPHIEFIGIAGPKMLSEGAKSLFPMERLSVSGYNLEVLRRYREIIGIRKKLIAHFSSDPPDLFIGVDAPDFNLHLEAALKAKNIPTLHYVSPSIWAWRGERIHKIGASISRMLTIFPFENALYEKENIPVSYVGHPLADELPIEPDKAAARAQIRMNHPSHVIALLPGSRENELNHHADLFIRAARLIHARLPEAHFLVPLASRHTRNQFEKAIVRLDAQDVPLTIMFGHSHDAMAAADAALVASGTATLEAALLKCPMVIAYKMSPLTYRIMKRKAYLPYVGLPNILAGEFIVPELLQDDATPRNLANALVNLLQQPRLRELMVNKFTAMHHSLRQNNAAKLVQAIQPYLTK
jgi:lipid-A-disaccharide synthase